MSYLEEEMCGTEKATILKRLIKRSGLSIRQFSLKAGIPYTTLLSILDRGVGKATVDNVIKICGPLGISVEQLYNMAGDHHDVCKMDFKDVLRELRTNRSLPQAELAKNLGVSFGLIGMYESGRRKPSYEMLEAIADYFNVSIDYLMGKDEKSVYYLDPDSAAIAQEVHSRPELKLLFDATRKISPEDLEFIISMVDRLKTKEGK